VRPLFKAPREDGSGSTRNRIAVNAVNNPKKMRQKMTTLPVKNSISRSPLRLAFLLIALACFALSPTARAVTPPPDGGYSNNNTAEGQSALFALTTGSDNTAIGFGALIDTTTGSNNTAVGFFCALVQHHRQ